MSNKKVLVLFCALILSIVILWMAGIIPEAIAKQTAVDYVKEHYEYMDLTYNSVEFSSAYGDYIVSFIGKDNEVYNFKVTSKCLFMSVAYDSILQSNV